MVVSPDLDSMCESISYVDRGSHGSHGSHRSHRSNRSDSEDEESCDCRDRICEDRCKKVVRGPRGERGLEGAKGCRGPEGPKGEKGCRGSEGAKGCRGPEGPKGERGPAGSKGEKGEKGCQGERGFDGPKGCRGPEGPVGPVGPAGPPCTYSCTATTLDFSEACHSQVYTVGCGSTQFNVVAYAGGCSPLRVGRHGIEVTHEGIQLDLSDYNRVKTLNCSPPRMKFSCIQKHEKITIYGSNTRGERGQQLYCYTNTSDSTMCKELTIPSFDTTNLTKSGDLYLYGPSAFKYITVVTCNKEVMLHSLMFWLYKLDCKERC